MQLKNALHINSYFLTNKIHYNLYKALVKQRQDRFLIPVYNSFKEKHIPNLDIDYVFTSIDKKLFFTKYIKIFNLIKKKGLKNGYDYIHAHTLISDGIAALLLSKLTKKKYVVTVRSTDVGYYMKKSALFRLLGKKVLLNATTVFFVAPSYRELIKKAYPEVDSTKFCLLPNGLDNFWIENAYERPTTENTFETFNILFVGHIIKRKKLDLLIEFIKKYNDRKYNLNIVGQNHLDLDFDEIAKSITNGNTVNYIGEVKNKEQLLEIYRKNDAFVLLSYAETFGVVYIEALSQGLPIIYTRGDGIDGYFAEGEVGYSCNHNSLEELKEKIDLTISNYPTISKNTKKHIQRFEWELIVDNYVNYINSVI